MKYIKLVFTCSVRSIDTLCFGELYRLGSEIVSFSLPGSESAAITDFSDFSLRSFFFFISGVWLAKSLPPPIGLLCWHPWSKTPSCILVWRLVSNQDFVYFSLESILCLFVFWLSLSFNVIENNEMKYLFFTMGWHCSIDCSTLDELLTSYSTYLYKTIFKQYYSLFHQRHSTIQICMRVHNT